LGVPLVRLEPFIEIEYFYGFNGKEIREIMSIIEENQEDFKIQWNEHFK